MLKISVMSVFFYLLPVGCPHLNTEMLPLLDRYPTLLLDVSVNGLFLNLADVRSI